MAIERSYVFETARIGAEDLADPGVAVSANKALQAMGLMLKPQIEVDRYRPYGRKYDTAMIPGKDWTQVDVMGRLDYNNAGYALASVLNSPDVTLLGSDVNEVQTITITGTPTGGTFTLTFKGETTTAIAYNAAAAVVTSALEALPTIGVGNVLCAGGALPGVAVTATFQGILAGTDVELMTADGALLTGGTSPAASVAETTPGVARGREWSFISHGTAPDLPQTYTVDCGSAIRAERATNVLFTEFSASFKRTSVELGGAAIGKLFTDNVYRTGDAVYTLDIADTVTGGTFTLTVNGQTTSAITFHTANLTADDIRASLAALSNVGPSDVVVTGGPGVTLFIITFTGQLGSQAVTMSGTFTSLTPAPGASAVTSTQAGEPIVEVVALPVIPGDINVYVDTVAANIGTTKLTRVFGADLQIGNRYSPMWTLNSDETSWAAYTETAPDMTVRLKMAANGAGMAYLDTIRNGSTVYLRIESIGDALPAPDNGQNFLFRWDMAAKIERPDDLSDHEGALAIDWTFRAMDGTDLGHVAEAFVRNMFKSL